jgi:hypothetical protein
LGDDDADFDPPEKGISRCRGGDGRACPEVSRRVRENEGFEDGARSTSSVEAMIRQTLSG